MTFRVVIAGSSELLRARTLRTLARLGVTAEACDDEELARALGRDEPTWILRAGAWPSEVPAFAPSATGKPLLGFGAIRGDRAWDELLARSGGILEAMTPVRVASLLVETPARLRTMLASMSLDDAACALARDGTRAVRVHAADVGFDTRVRACIAVTGLRRGGAERVAIDTANALRREGAAVLFAVTGARANGDYEAPDDTLFVRDSVSRHAEIVPALAKAAVEHGADVVHTHLFDADDIRELASHLPVVVTVHNDRARWPNGFDAVTCDEAALTLGCSWRVRDQLVQSGMKRARVAPNGVDVERLGGAGDRESTRRALEIPSGALFVLAIANPRSQKRLELAVEAVAALRAERDAVLVIAGDAVPGDDGARASAALDAAIEGARAASWVRRIGSRADIAPLLRAADVHLTTSLFEGMSVAHLEALAARLPVVTTEVGGARELARLHRGYVVADATPVALARAMSAAASAERPSLSPHFEARALARRHERAYRAAALASRPRANALVLVINNFSTGGAQASSKRLLLELHARGHDVAAVVLQEQARYPTAWRAELEARIPVLVAPNRGADPAASAEAIAAFAASRRARTVVFWNAMPAHKLLAADELAGVRLFDVSPGEMHFAALDRYFASPRADVPYFDARDFGTLLEGVVVKFAAEASRARETFGAPVHVIPNGVPFPASRPRTRRGDRFVIGTLARVSRDKKLEELVEATRALPPGCEVRIAGRVERGEDAYAEELRARATGLPITFVGEVDAPSFLAELDAFAMVSEPEGCPNALLEAMAAGLPVAATDAGGARDAAGDGAASIVPRGDGHALGVALARIVRDPELCGRLASAAGERIRTTYSVERMTNDYEALFFG